MLSISGKKVSRIKMKTYKLLIIIILLLFISLFTLFSLKNLNPSFYETLIKKQAISGILAIFIAVLTSNINYIKIKPFSQIIYFFSIILLIFTFFYEGKHGSQRWIQLSQNLYFQPSEFVKIGLVLYLADLFSSKSERKFEMLFLKGLSVMTIPLLIIILQPDLGTSIMLFSAFLAIAFSHHKMKLKYTFILSLIILLLIPLSYKYLLRDYQKKRLLAFLNPDEYALNEGYQIIQAKKLIGAGGLYGNFHTYKDTLRFIKSIPERHNDFIFTSIAYKFGFIGASIVVVLYFIFAIITINIFRNTREEFGKFVVVGLSSLFTLQAFINIGMNLGLFPITGITLPFLSYGGSSNISFGLLVGLLTSVDKYKDKNFCF